MKLSLRSAAAYALMVAAAVGLFFLIRSVGDALPPPAAAPAPDTAAPPTPKPADVLFHVLLALAAVIVTGRVLGRLLRHVGQPPVIGEVIAGILLGPSLLGWASRSLFAFDASAALLPAEVAPYLGVIAQLGVVLYVFLVGLDLNAGLLRDKAHATVAIAHASIVVPFVLGAALALGLFSRYGGDGPGLTFTSFALFMGAAMSITAFPVLARILGDRRLTRTDLGVVALTCAATDDATAWCLLAFVVGVAQAQLGRAVLVIGLTLGYVSFTFLVVRPVAARLASRFDDDTLTPGVVAGVLAAVLASALVTELIGIHAIFGAFLLGAVIPHDSALARGLTRKLEDVVTVLLLPAFFALTGMRTRIDLIAGWEGWLACAAIVLVATAGKFGGTLAAARVTGLDWRTSAALGALMNTRGLMGLIVLDVGLGLRVLSPALYSMMVLMAVATTLATSPALGLLAPAATAPHGSTQRRLAI